MLMGEGPARDEDRVRRNFYGRADQEFDMHYLPLAGLVRGEVYVTNAARAQYALALFALNRSEALTVGRAAWRGGAIAPERSRLSGLPRFASQAAWRAFGATWIAPNGSMRATT